MWVRFTERLAKLELSSRDRRIESMLRGRISPLNQGSASRCCSVNCCCFDTIFQRVSACLHAWSQYLHRALEMLTAETVFFRTRGPTIVIGQEPDSEWEHASGNDKYNASYKA